MLSSFRLSRHQRSLYDQLQQQTVGEFGNSLCWTSPSLSGTARLPSLQGRSWCCRYISVQKGKWHRGDTLSPRKRSELKLGIASSPMPAPRPGLWHSHAHVGAWFPTAEWVWGVGVGSGSTHVGPSVCYTTQVGLAAVFLCPATKTHFLSH